MPKFVALNDKILVKYADAINVSEGGIMMPTNVDKPDYGVVISVGPDVKHITEGMNIAIAPKSGVQINLGNDDYIVIAEVQVLGIMKD